MKKIGFVWAFVLFALSVTAQSKKNFEGSILYSFEASGGGEEMEMAKAFMPTGYLFKIKGDNSRMSMQGGMMAAMMGDVVVNAAKEQVYMLNDANKSAMLMPKDDTRANEDASNYSVEKGSDKRKIAGYDCEHFLVKSKTGEQLAEYWVTNDIAVKTPKGKAASTSPIGQGNSFGIEGFPLRVQMNQMGMLITMEAKEVKKEKLSMDLFEVPKGYTISDFNPAMFQMGGDE